MHTFTLNIGPGIAPPIKGCGILQEIHANFFENSFGIVFDDFEGLVVQHFKVRYIPRDEARGIKTDGCAACPPRSTTASTRPASWR